MSGMFQLTGVPDLCSTCYLYYMQKLVLHINSIAPFAGKVKEIKVAKGDKVKTGSLIMIFAVDTVVTQSAANT
ncbi:MAG: biotin/lipoyl-containing protein, partial [Arsenophonus sp. NC-TX2-MAG3]